MGNVAKALGLIAAGIAGGLLFTAVFRLLPRADAAAWLSLAGTAIGIFGAILTAVYIEDRKASAARRADLTLLAHALFDISTRFGVLFGGEATKQVLFMSIEAHDAQLDNCITFLDEARSALTTPDFATLNAVRLARNALHDSRSTAARLTSNVALADETTDLTDLGDMVNRLGQSVQIGIGNALSEIRFDELARMAVRRN